MTIPTALTHQDRLLTVSIHSQQCVTHPIDGYDIHPLFLDREMGTWVLYARFPPGTRLPKHFHTGPVHFFTTKGAWHYVEYPEDLQTAGSYLYEPGGSIHTFMVPEDAEEAAEGFMVVSGANINFDDRDQLHSIMDAGFIEDAIAAICADPGAAMPRYIRPGNGAAFSS